MVPKLFAQFFKRGKFYIFFSAIVLIFLILLLISSLTGRDPSRTTVPQSPTPVQQKIDVHTDSDKPLVPTQDPLYLEKIKAQPWREVVPYWTDHYKVDYRQSTNKIIIYTLAENSGNRTQYQQESVRYREEALQWLRSNGANLNEFTIEYSPSTF